MNMPGIIVRLAGPRELKYTISSVLREAEKQAGRRLRRVHVGVPGDFTQVVLKRPVFPLGKRGELLRTTWSCSLSGARIFPLCVIIPLRTAVRYIL